MNCPTCDRSMNKKESGPDRARNGKTYDWTRYHCGYDDVWIETWEPQELG